MSKVTYLSDKVLQTDLGSAGFQNGAKLPSYSNCKAPGAKVTYTSLSLSLTKPLAGSLSENGKMLINIHKYLQLLTF